MFIVTLKVLSSNHQNYSKINELMKKEKLNCKKAQNLCLLKVLARFEHFPIKESEKEAWFLSPLRSETQASFKVSKLKNRWYDHGFGIGGNTVDIVISILKCSVKEALNFLNNEITLFSFQQQHQFYEKRSSISIVKKSAIQHPGLINYIESRKIPLTTANTYCHEVWYENNGKTFFAIGLKNKGGGWELRNKYYKTSTSPKTFSYINKGNTSLIITEGMFDLFSLDTILKEKIKKLDILVLNSVAFAKRVVPLLANYKKVLLYLDNDDTGNIVTNYLLDVCSNSYDHRELYKGYKDANEKIIS